MAAPKCACPWPGVKYSFASHQGIDAPRAPAREREIEKNEAIERGEFAAVQYRVEPPAGMRHEIGGRREARENEGDRPCQQADREQDASDQFDQATHPGQRTDVNVREAWNHGKAENLSVA